MFLILCPKVVSRVKLLNTSNLRDASHCWWLLSLASLSARSFSFTMACSGQYIHRSFWWWMSNIDTCQSGLCIPLFTFCRRMACVVWLSSHEAIPRRACVTASTSGPFSLESETIIYTEVALSSWQTLVARGGREETVLKGVKPTNSQFWANVHWISDRKSNFIIVLSESAIANQIQVHPEQVLNADLQLSRPHTENCAWTSENLFGITHWMFCRHRSTMTIGGETFWKFYWWFTWKFRRRQRNDVGET